MHRIMRFVFIPCLIFFAALSVNSGQDFEGKVKFKISSEGESTDMNYFVKDGKIRVEVNEEMEVVLINDGDKMYMLMPSQGMYMDFSDSMKDFAGEKDEDIDDTNLEKTGEKKEILGYTTEKWIIPDEDDITELWVSEELGNFMFLSNPMQQNRPAWQSKIGAEGFFPLLIVNRDKSGNELGRWEVTEMSPQKLDEDLFKIPSNLMKMDMPGMMQRRD